MYFVTVNKFCHSNVMSWRLLSWSCRQILYKSCTQLRAAPCQANVTWTRDNMLLVCRGDLDYDAKQANQQLCQRFQRNATTQDANVASQLMLLRDCKLWLFWTFHLKKIDSPPWRLFSFSLPSSCLWTKSMCPSPRLSSFSVICYFPCKDI